MKSVARNGNTTSVDPDNRLVASELEARWNASLTQRLAQLETEYGFAATRLNSS